MQKHFPFGLICLVGLIFGILFANSEKGILLTNSGILDEYTLYHMQYMTVDSSALFALVLRKRLGSALLLALLATTWFGMAACAGAAAGFGWVAGIFLTAAFMRFGLRGIPMTLAAVLPQYLLYLPGFYLLLRWCEETHRGIAAGKIQAPNLTGRVLRFLAVCVVIFIGCVLESFSNPPILKSFLKML